jgi:ATP-dependent Lon protease
VANTTSQLTLPVLPLRNGVVFPHMVVTLQVDTEEGKTALDAAGDAGGQILLVPRIDEDFATYGTIARIQNMESGDSRTVLVQGLSRARIGSGLNGANGALWVEATPIAEPDHFDTEVDTLVEEYRAVVARLLRIRGMGGIADRVLSIDDPGQLADLAVYSPDLSLEQKIELLETPDVRDRLEQLLEWMADILTDAEVRKQVEDDTAGRIEKGQREYVLRQQLAAIKAELGEDAEVVDEYRERLATVELPKNVFEAVEKEVDRLERMSEQSPEHSWIRTWLDTVFDLPWGEKSEDNLDLGSARTVLDEDHTGLDDVKERIVEYLAVRKLRAERDLDDDAKDRRDGAILLLVGPPGVGKTSLGESVARALGRDFVRVALGGVRDEAEVRGHRRTYVGARPGRIARALVDAGTMNPVFLLDEMDKVGNDWRGDPSSALLEVLDPAQNHTFRDSYLEFDLDLSDVLFIATANVVDSIPAPLLDRTEVINLDGYTDAEKVGIATQHLLPKRKKAAGLADDELTVTDEALVTIVDGYTREAGVRGLERQLGKLVRKVVTKIAMGEESAVNVDTDDVKDLLGKPKVHHDEAKDRTSVPGVATGLAVTGAGGDVLFVEATAMDGEPGLTLTGQLGDVMKESAQIALSYVKANADELDLVSGTDQRFHVHVPAGAVPKDGPSAGVTMTTALVSLLTNRKVKENVGMTGELTLAGKVLPIGGVKQKVLAAHRAGLDTVILPARNADDLDDVPDEVREQMTFHTAENINEVIELALV